jgi:hypothetical protein
MNTAAAPCSAKRALELCELWTRRDIAQYHDAPFRMNLEHRLACIREGMADPMFQSTVSPDDRIDETLAVLVARLEAKQPMYHADGEWDAIMKTCESLRAAKRDIARYVHEMHMQKM